MVPQLSSTGRTEVGEHLSVRRSQMKVKQSPETLAAKHAFFLWGPPGESRWGQTGRSSKHTGFGFQGTSRREGNSSCAQHAQHNQPLRSINLMINVPSLQVTDLTLISGGQEIKLNPAAVVKEILRCFQYQQWGLE